jgi:hypothetical protein
LAEPSESGHVDRRQGQVLHHPFVYRCPRTGHRVQGFVPAEDVSEDANTFHSVRCILCNQDHLVNPKTGKVVGEDE